MTRSASQTGVSILGGFRVIKSERKVRFGQTWWQSKGLMEYYHIKLFKRQSRPFIKPQNPKSSKTSYVTFKLLFMITVRIPVCIPACSLYAVCMQSVCIQYVCMQCMAYAFLRAVLLSVLFLFLFSGPTHLFYTYSDQ